MTSLIAVEEIVPGVGLRTWFGNHTVAAILPYDGPFNFIHNILRFSNGVEMSTEKGCYLERS